MIAATLRWLDGRVGVARIARRAVEKVFPDHWSFLLGELALYSFVVLVATGTFLAFLYEPSTATVTYRGSYAPLRGIPVSQAYRSALDLSFDVRSGLVMRQTHHWAALVFVGSIATHMLRVFFTGAFRRPRDVNWLVGCTMFLLAILNGFAGYSLLDDQLSGTGLRIAYSVALSIPLIGTWIASLAFGGPFPGDAILERLFVLHVLVVPVALAGLLGLHLALVVRHRHTQYPGPAVSEHDVVGVRLWPTYAFKSAGLFFLVVAALVALGGLVQINPIWLYGPFRVANVSTASQPDWYMAWLEGAMRLMPPWEVRAFGYEVPNPFFPGVLLPGITFLGVYLWPFVERRWTRDVAEHHVLDNPRDRPVRTAIGAGVVSFYLVLSVAGADDVVAKTFGIPMTRLLWLLRGALVVLPPLVALATYRVCRELRARDAPAAPGPGRTDDGAA